MFELRLKDSQQQEQGQVPAEKELGVLVPPNGAGVAVAGESRRGRHRRQEPRLSPAGPSRPWEQPSGRAEARAHF